MNALKQNIYFIINPKSGRKHNIPVKKVIEATIDTNAFNIHFIETATLEELSKAIEKIKTNTENIVIAVGGDGTINRVVNEIVNAELRFGIIPTGSGNGLARELNIPLKIKSAVETINQNNFIPIDLIQINDQYSINVSGIGFDAIIANKFNDNKNRGFINYVKITANEIKSIKSETYHLIIDGEPLTTKAYLISFANSRQWGNNAYIAPEAKIDDGLIDIVIMHPAPLIASSLIAAKLFAKKINHSNFIDTIKAREVIVNKAGSIQVHIDGEPHIFENSLNIKIHPKKINILVPQSSQT